MNRSLVLFSCFFVFASVSPSYADLNLKNGSVIRFTDGTILSTAPSAPGPADHGGVANTVGGTNSFIGGLTQSRFFLTRPSLFIFIGKRL